MKISHINWRQLGLLATAGVIGGVVTLSGWWWLGGRGAVMTSAIGGEAREIAVSVEENSATIEAVKRVLPSVVAIVSRQNVRGIFGGVYQVQGGGSGFVVRSDGLIVTNRHVVDDSNAQYSVVTADGKSYDAQVVAKDTVADLALVKISASNLQVAELGDSDKLALGQRVIAIGNTLGQYQNSVTTGVVSGIGRSITAGSGLGASEQLENVIQTDAAINPGNSGGPLVNLSGQVIGINTAIDAQGQLVGFAIPINSVKPQIQTVAAGGEIVRPQLGVRYITLTKEIAALNDMDISEGALVVRGETAAEVAVMPGGPADLAGIKEGDILVAINNDKIVEGKSLMTILSQYKPGDSVSVRFLREGRERTVTVRLGKL